MRVITREGLVDAARRDRGIVTIEAPAGFGKSTFVDQLTSGVRQLVVTLGAGDDSAGRLFSRIAESAASGGNTRVADSLATTPDDRRWQIVADNLRGWLDPDDWFVVDDAHHLAGPDAEVLAEVVAVWRSHGPCRLAIAGRAVPDGARGELHIGAADLVFRADDIDTLCSERGIDSATARRQCREVTRGWPAAVALWLNTGGRGDVSTGSSPTDGGGVIEPLVRWATRELTSLQRSLIGALPLINESVCRAIDWPGGITELHRAGLPLRRAGEWWQVADVVREQLPRTDPIPRAVATRVAEAFALGGHILHAVDLLLSRGQHDDLAALVGRLRPEVLERADLYELATVVLSLPRQAIARAVDTLLSLAVATGGRVLPGLRIRLLDEADRLTGDTPSPTTRRIEVERVLDLATNAEFDAADARGAAVLDRLTDGEPLAKTRCLYALGQSAAIRGDADSMMRAAVLMNEAAGLARVHGFDYERIQALSSVAFQVHFGRGEFDASLVRLEEAISAARPRTRIRATVLALAGEVLAFVGRDAEALEALEESLDIARWLSDDRSIAYAAWALARLAARRRDLAAVHRWHEIADARRGSWFEHPTGAEFCAATADHCAIAGDEQGARAGLERARAHPATDQWPDICWPAEVSIEVRFGDPARVPALVRRLLDDGYTKPAERWRYRLWAAAATARFGGDEARAQWAEVKREVAALGRPDLPHLHEPEMVELLTKLDRADDQAPPNDEAVIDIAVLGRFAVTSASIDLALPIGKPQQLVKVLAVLGRPVTDDEMADLLWPGTDIEVGRRRLRNVLARVRAVAPLVTREGSMFVLDRRAVVDLMRFESQAKSALRAGSSGAIERSIEALRLYEGELLPADRFEEWTELPRERLRVLSVRLAERIAERATDAEDVDAAVHAIERLLDADPYGDRWADRAAELLRRHGQDAAADAWSARADAIRRCLGL